MTNASSKPIWILGITGASGTRYALRLLEVLPTLVDHLHVIVSDSAIRVLAEEEGLKVSGSSMSLTNLVGVEAGNVTFYNSKDIGARVASGTLLADGMVIAPCSMSTVGALASGAHSHLVHRAADVTLKENRTLIIVPRETPLSVLHLENLCKLARAGVRVVPAMPGFYNRPECVADVVDLMVMKILDQMRIPNDLAQRWNPK